MFIYVSDRDIGPPVLGGISLRQLFFKSLKIQFKISFITTIGNKACFDFNDFFVFTYYL